MAMAKQFKSVTEMVKSVAESKDFKRRALKMLSKNAMELKARAVARGKKPGPVRGS